MKQEFNAEGAEVERMDAEDKTSFAYPLRTRRNVHGLRAKIGFFPL
jgi:hypothetical protein